MQEKLELKMAALTKRAKESGRREKSSGRNRSSLHRVMKSKEQAKAFMKLLQSS
jgi:hypothetical protein